MTTTPSAKTMLLPVQIVAGAEDSHGGAVTFPSGRWIALSKADHAALRSSAPSTESAKTMLELAEVANYGAKKLGEIDLQYVAPKLAGVINTAIERFWLIARKAMEEAVRSPAPSVGVDVPNGYALVPLIPTPKMIEVGCENNPTMWTDETDDGFACTVANDIYVSMVRVASALVPSQKPSVGVDVRDALTAFTDFINEPPQYEGLRMVREYRHELAGKWSPLLDKLLAALTPSQQSRAGEVKPVAWRVDGHQCGKPAIFFYYKDTEFLQAHRDSGDKITPLYETAPAGAK
jgi:hypothetical protein